MSKKYIAFISYSTPKRDKFDDVYKTFLETHQNELDLKSYNKKIKRIYSDITKYRLKGSYLKDVNKNPNNIIKLKGKVFFDQMHLSDTHYPEQIQNTLNKSEHLIVICSKFAARSAWVNKEIIYFLSDEKRSINDVSIVIVDDGKPFADGSDFNSIDTNEVLPLSLRFKTRKTLFTDKPSIHELDNDKYKYYLNENIKLSSNDINFIYYFEKKPEPKHTLIANITGISKYDLIDQANKNILASIFIPSVAIVAMAATLYWWNTSEHATYYENYYEKFLIPIGINKIDSQATYRPYIYKITKKCGFLPFVTACRIKRLDRIKTINANKDEQQVAFKGQDVESELWLQDISSWELEYNEKNDLVKKSFYITSGKLLFWQDIMIRKKDTAEVKFTYGEIDNSKPKNLNDPSLTSKAVTARESTSISSTNFIFGNKGNTENKPPNSLKATPRTGKAVVNISSLDKNNDLLSDTFYKEKPNEPRGTKKVADSAFNYSHSIDIDKHKYQIKVSKFHITFNSEGNIKQRLFKDSSESKNQPINGSFGRSYQYNTSGLTTARCNLNKQFIETDCLNFIYANDKQKQISSLIIKWSKPKDKAGLLLNTKGYAIYEKITTRKELYTSITTSYKGKSSERVLGPYGYSIIKQKFDQFGRLTSKSYFDTHSNPLVFSQGFATVRKKYYQNGNLKEQCYYDVKDNLTLHTDGTACVRYKYNEEDQITKKTFIGLDYSKTNIKSGYAYITYEYEDQSRWYTKESFFDKNDQAINNQFNFASSIIKRFSNGKINKVIYLNTKGNRTPHSDGNVSYISTFNEAENIETRTFFGLNNGERVLIKNGFSKFIQKTSIKENQEKVIEVSYFGKDDEKVLHQNGYHKKISTYHQKWKWKLIKEQYLDINNSPIKINAGYAALEKKYNSHGDNTEIRYFDEKGELALQKDGYAIYKVNRYSPYHIVEEYLGSEGNKVFNKAKGFSSVEFIKNNYGKITKEQLLNVKGERIIGKQGYSVREWNYSQVNGQLVSVKNYGIKPDQLINLPIGYAGFKRILNGKNRIAKELYFDADGKETSNSNGCALEEYNYNGRGYKNKITCFSFNRNSNKYEPALNNEGFHVGEFEYTTYGYIKGESYRGIDNKPVEHKTLGYFRSKSIHDKKRRLVERRFYDKDKTLKLFDDSYAIIKYQYNEQGLINKESYFGVDGHAKLIDKGYSEVSYQYDEKNNETDVRYYGIKNNPIKIKEGYGRKRLEYDERNNVILEEYYGADHKKLLILQSKGYAKVSRDIEYKKDNIIIIAKQYDEEGELITETSTLNPAPIMKAELDLLKNTRTYWYLDKDSQPILVEGYSIFTEKYDDYGRVTQRKYFNKNNELVITKHGYASERLEYFLNTEKITKISYHGLENELVLDDTGISILKEKYDPESNLLTDIYFLGKESQPILGDDGYYHSEYKYNSKGKIKTKAFYDTRGKSVISLKKGYAKYTASYHPVTDVLIEESFFNQKGKLVVPNKELTYAHMTRTLDKTNTKILQVKVQATDKKERPILPDQYKLLLIENGKVVSTTYTDKNWLPKVNNDGYTNFVKKYDENGFVSEEFYTDVKNDLITPKSLSFAKTVIVSDKHGNTKSVTYFDENKKETLGKDGYATIKQKYDNNNFIKEARYFDEKGHAIMLKDGYAKYASKNNKEGKELEVSYFDVNDELIDIKDLEYAFVKNDYYENGVLKEKSAYKAKKLDQPFFVQKYDKNGNPSKLIYLNNKGKPDLGSRGYAEYQTIYDDKNRLVSESYHDEKSKYINGGNLDYALVKIKYYENGVTKQAKYYKAKKQDHPYYIYAYDKKGNLSNIIYFDDSGKPNLGDRGYAENRMIYDDQSRIVNDSYYDEKGKSINVQAFDYALIKKEYYEDGVLKQEKAYKEKNLDQPYYIQTYDKKGNQRKITYYDVKGKASLGERGYAEYRTKYNDNKMLVSESYFDKKGNFIVPKLFGYAKKENKYYKDSFMQTEESYFDESGNLMLQEELGYAKVTYKIEGSDLTLWKTDTRYYDDNNKPVKISEGYARLVIKLSKDKKFIEAEQFVDEFGELINSKNGFAVINYQNDQKSGNTLLKEYFDTQNNPVEDTQGIHSIKYSYETNNDGTSYQLESYYNLQDNPVINKEKYATKKSTLNRLGQVVSEKYLNELGKPVLTAGGYSSVKYNYESPLFDGFVKYFDLFGKEVKPIGQCSVDVHK